MVKALPFGSLQTVKRNQRITQIADREIIDSLKKYVMLLNAEGILVNKAYLFRSYSDDTASEESDIDVLIVSDKYDENDDFTKGWIEKIKECRICIKAKL